MGSDKVENNLRINSLDYLRGFFTLYIVVHHLSLFTYHKAFFFITGQGQFVVIIFLIMSGISQELSQKAVSQSKFWIFFKKIFLRIYPLFLLSLVLTYVLCLLNPDSSANFNWQDVLGHLLNIQDLENRHSGIWVYTFLSNTPLWYVSYVWWSYILFFFCRKAPTDRQLLYALGISIFGYLSFHLYPNTISHILYYFLIFWSGVEFVRAYQSKNLIRYQALKKILSAVGFMIFLSVVPLFFNENLVISYYPVIELRHYLYCFIAIFLGAWWIEKEKPGLHFLYFFRKITPFSYALFLFHYPLMIVHNPFHFSNIWINYLCSFLLTLLLAFSATKANNKITTYLNQK